jgi:uncharacterized protein (DUF488 family)
MGDPPTLLTVGHSTLPWEDFLALLAAHRVKVLADVRLMPQSRRHPQFKQDNMKAALREAGIEYVHFPELGGMRKPKPDSRNAGWKNDHFRGYADYMDTEAFARGLDRLNALLPRGPVAVMCAEAVPWRCHRSLISDAEAARGVAVSHILGRGAAKPHAVTAFAQVDSTRDPPRLSYPADLAADLAGKRRRAADAKAVEATQEKLL